MKLPKPILDLVDMINTGPAVKHRGVMGVFYYVDDVTEAVRALRQSGHQDLRVYSPVPYHDVERALDQGQSIVRWVTLGGALCGITGGWSRSASTPSTPGRWWWGGRSWFRCRRPW